MFNNSITRNDLKILKPVADKMFKQIPIEGIYGQDLSLTATLRAVIHKRMKPDDIIHTVVQTRTYTRQNLQGARDRDCVRAFLGRAPLSNTLYVIGFSGSQDGNDACMEVVSRFDFKKEFQVNCVRLPKLEVFLKQNAKTDAIVIVCEEIRSTMIFVKDINIRKYHFLQSAIIQYFPWYKEVAPLDENERDLLKTLTRKYAPEYIELVEKFGNQFDFRTEQIRAALSEFEIGLERKKLEDIQQEIDYKRRRMDELHDKIASIYREIEDMTTTEAGLQVKIRNRTPKDGEDSEFCQYFLRNKSLELIDNSGSFIKFMVKGTVSNFDPEVAEQALNNDNSFFYYHWETGEYLGGDLFTSEQIKRLMSAVFLDEKIKLRTCAVFYLDFRNGSYGAERWYSYPKSVLDEYTPNEHLNVYACIGNNDRYIGNCVRDHDYIGAVTYCCASNACMNLTEPNTGTFFMQKILSPDAGKIIELPDGSNVTPLDAVKWLEEQDVEKKKEEEAHE